MRLLSQAVADTEETVRSEASARFAMHRQRYLRLEAANQDLRIHRLRRAMRLSGFEEECLWLAVACAVDGHVGDLVANCHRDSRWRLPTPWLCLTLFASNRLERFEALSAFDADAPLFESGVLRFRDEPSEGPMLRPFCAAPFVVAFLRGLQRLDSRIAAVARITEPRWTLEQVALSADDRARLDRFVPMIRQIWATICSGEKRKLAGVMALVSGPRGVGKSSCVRAIAGECGASLIEMDCPRLSAMPIPEAAEVLRVAFSQAALEQAWLLFDACDRLFRDPPADSPFTDQPTLTGVLCDEWMRRPVIGWLTCESLDSLSPMLRDRLMFRHDLKPLDRKTSEMVWQLNCPDEVELDLDVDFSALATTFPLSGRAIQSALTLATMGSKDPVLRQSTLVEAASLQHVPGLGVMARRTFVHRSREDLLLPGPIAAQVDEIIETERVRERVLHEWGLGGRMQKGLGIVCLFDGEPGTGKTLTAEVIASELALPLYMVNVANVVSKWIGETEKNLQAIFDEAQKGRCVLLFDEADALFSRRTEVSRSVDRYANMEVSLLLQVIEAYPGLVILTTNLKEAMDVAFLRRITFKLNFPFPDAGIRRAIWARLLPKDRLAADVDLQSLAENYELSGGSIRTCVLRASYRAAREGGRLTAAILREVCEQESKALGKLVRETRK